MLSLISSTYHTFKSAFAFFLLLLYYATGSAQNYTYSSLDPNTPITFNGQYIVFEKDTIPLGPKSFFIDGQLSDAIVNTSPFVFNSIQEATKHLTSGTASEPMVLNIAPYVYWIDDPDAPEIRTPENGSIPYGLKIQCDWLTFNGLTKNSEHVVLACNRGQTMGAKGNFTMFYIDGIGTTSENITFGNFCNIDLKYNLKPELSRPKRGSAIVQAQLIICNGDKVVARNTRFISRLNLCPFVGAKRAFFDRCHFESTDDALNGSAIYKNCTLDFYSSKPFYHTTGTGAIFLNCDINIYTKGTQYFTKANGQLAVIDTRFTGENVSSVQWCDELNPATKNYQHNITLNNKPIRINNTSPEHTVLLDDKHLLNAYVFNYKNETIYNTYNLLSGDDDWDPEHLKSTVLDAEKTLKTPLTQLPIQLKVTPDKAEIETGKDSLYITASLFRFGNTPAKNEPVTWHINEADKNLVILRSNKNTCMVIPTNTLNVEKDVSIQVKTASGLEGLCNIKVKPATLPPPSFSAVPKINKLNDGSFQVTYAFANTAYQDESEITWYRCADAACNNPKKAAVSRLHTPLKKYTLSATDVNQYIMVSVAPKTNRSQIGDSKTVINSHPIKTEDVLTDPNIIFSDFKNTPTNNSNENLKGYWNFKPLINDNASTTDTSKDAWFFGEGKQGSANQLGLLQTGRTASLNYTPLNPKVKDMTLTLTVSPFKTAGQGFSVAPLYMDIFINFDPITKTGHALRLIRTTKYGNAIDCYFVAYHNNTTKAISDPVTTSAFRTPCTIRLQLEGKTLSASLKTTANYHSHDYPKEVKPFVDIQTTIAPLPFNSFGIEYNGGSSTMINSFKAEGKAINTRPE